MTDVVQAPASSDIDIQIATAKAHPRSIEEFKQKARTMATLDTETAAACNYCLPRDGKKIEGPSARFAEIVAVAWGNIRYAARPAGIQNGQVMSEGVALDLENNVAASFTSARRITTKEGKRYGDDMIAFTQNAASSIAMRNAVLKVVPKAYWGPIFNEVREVIAGSVQTLNDRRQAAIEYFDKTFKVTVDRVLKVLGRKSIEDITTDDMVTLKGIITAINEGDTTVEQTFPVPKEAPKEGRMSLKKQEDKK